jgi:beta-glucosidase
MERRNFLKSAFAVTAAPAVQPWLSTSAAAAELPKISAPTPRSFPQGFLWGTATAAYQVEGAVNADGRGPSVWDTFSHTPGKIWHDETADVADDFFDRYKQDVALMKELGTKAFRFSIAWPRVFPQGTGTPNPKGLDFYKRLLEELQAAGIEPYATLFHWDLPQALQDKGGWASRATAQAFADYASYTAGQLSDYVAHWMTINEFDSFIDAGYADGSSAPGLKLSRREVMQARHYAVLAHGLGVQAIRAAGKRPVKVGLAEDISEEKKHQSTWSETPDQGVVEGRLRLDELKRRQNNVMVIDVVELLQLQEGELVSCLPDHIGQNDQKQHSDAEP